MDDYEKKTVAVLRSILKERGIPSTGLTKKAQIVEKLVEYDALQDAEMAAPAHNAPAAPSEPMPDDATEDPAVSQPEGTTATVQPNAQVEAAPTPIERPMSTSSSVTLQTDDVTRSHRDEQTRPAPPEEHEPTAPQPTPPAPQSANEETPMPTTQTSESVTPAKMDPEEIAEDTRKRKRRSVTPRVDGEEVALKRAKHLEGEVIMKEDIAPEVTIPVEEMKSGDAEVLPDAQEEDATEALGKSTAQMTNASAAIERVVTVAEKSPPTNEAKTAVIEESNMRPPAKRGSEVREGRFRSLLRGEGNDAEEIDVIAETEDLPAPPPALHHATRAVYIRNLMRPLHDKNLQNYIAQIASFKDSSDRPTLELFYLDPIRTHAFAILPSISAAARVRMALHDRVWPQERDRKPLWVDYVPEEKVQEWIDEEKRAPAGPRGAGIRRWEVVYEQVEGVMEARLAEVGASSGRASDGYPSGPLAARVAPRSPEIQRQPSMSSDKLIAPQQPPQSRKSFQTLDSLFNSTETAKPKLYFKPVAKELAERRLHELQMWTRRDWDERDRRRDDELRRYTFEDGDKLVDAGPHYMSKAQLDKEGLTTSAPSGPRGGGRGGRGRGGRPRPQHDIYRGEGGGSHRDLDDPYANGPRGQEHGRDRSRDGERGYRGGRGYGGGRSYGNDGGYGGDRSFGGNRSYGDDRSYGGGRSYGEGRNYEDDRSYGRERGYGGNRSYGGDRSER